ncbi:hypothetical protein P280DRAFT_465539 [Massarina eburnea CBS 473.64]|uniref:Uncharacterized protein n=1 Tax=Massarina eburnea CBS 473.64 TaxID=1395130 RepID=A0A6A6SFC6_9PLEO|nr:hypothetical protein P280DRAFT_465539 [Massarina eburnea CBS 473.64]
MQQDELARLFSAHMNLSQAPAQQTPQPEPQQHQAREEQPPAYNEIEQASQPITYISQHYTHSYHVAPVRHTASAPPTTTDPHVDPSELVTVLLRNSIDPTLLFPSQIELFRNADSDQRLRLLELWRISPPQGRQGFPNGVDYNTSRQLYDWPPTSLAQEEATAKLRYESLMEEKAQQAQQDEIRKHEQELDQSMDMGMEPVSVQATPDILTERNEIEPYIVSGYEMMAAREYEQSTLAANHLKESSKYNQATDPAYGHTANSGGLWEKNVGSIFDMENQYGAFAHARDHDVRPVYVDDEMMM